MNTVVIYATRTGNTRLVAEAIARRLRPFGTATVVPIESASVDAAGAADLVAIGGPTEGHGPTPEVRAWVEAVPPGALAGTVAATFDTRLKWPRLLSGSAADDIAEQLRGLGARVIAEESFLVSRKPELLPGELARAEAWAETLPGLVGSHRPAVAGNAR
jgi:flavodoxin